MKKKVFKFLAVAFLTIIVSACSLHPICPAYSSTEDIEHQKEKV